MLREPVEDPRALLSLDPELGEQLAVEVGVAEPEDGAVQPDGVERRAQHLEHLGGALRRRRAEQLDPGVHELAHLAALWADDPVGVADVGEAQRRLGVGEAGGDQAGDRDRHVGAQREQLAALVEEAVGADPAAALAALQHLVVLERRRRHLAVAEALEDVDQGRLERAKLAHLVRQDVPGARGYRVDHEPPIMATRSLTGCKVQGDRVGARSTTGGGDCDGSSCDPGVRGDARGIRAVDAKIGDAPTRTDLHTG